MRASGNIIDQVYSGGSFEKQICLKLRTKAITKQHHSVFLVISRFIKIRTLWYNSDNLWQHRRILSKCTNKLQINNEKLSLLFCEN